MTTTNDLTDEWGSTCEHEEFRGVELGEFVSVGLTYLSETTYHDVYSQTGEEGLKKIDTSNIRC